MPIRVSRLEIRRAYRRGWVQARDDVPGTIRGLSANEVFDATLPGGVCDWDPARVMKSGQRLACGIGIARAAVV